MNRRLYPSRVPRPDPARLQVSRVMSAIIVSATLFVAPPESAASEAKKTAKRKINCGKPTTAAEIGICALKSHPVVRIRMMRMRVRRAAAGKANQRPNPELDGRITGNGADVSAEIAYTHTLELGGKRKARVKSARAELTESTILLQIARWRALADVLTLLTRLRHNEMEQNAHREARHTYARMLNRIRRYPFLSPSSRAALAVFRASLGASDLVLAELVEERARLITDLRLIMGPGFQLTLAALPSSQRLRWPTPGAAGGEPLKVKLARARLAMAQAGLTLQQSKAIPNLSIGPALDYRRVTETERFATGIVSDSAINYSIMPGRRNSQFDVGLSFRITLPLYHRNQGGVAGARTVVSASRLELRIARRRVAAHRLRLEKTYKQAVAALKSSRRKSVRIKGLHAGLERQMLRGIIQPSLVVELHREMLEYIHRRNRMELKARKSLLRLREAQGHALNRELINELFSD